MADPASIGAAAGAGLAAIAAFVKLYRSGKEQKARDSELLEALKVFKDIIGVGNGKNGKPKGSDGIPGFAPECLQRAIGHSERIRANETRIEGFEARFDGLNRKIDGVEKEIRGQIKDLREDVEQGFDDLKKEIRAQ